MGFAKRVYLTAGILGIVLVAPAYFLERWTGESDPPPITHAEYYYGLITVIVVWQFVYLKIGTDPVRLRPIMPLAALAKGTFVATIVTLLAVGKVAPRWVGFVAFDGTFTVLFLMAYQRTPDAWPSVSTPPAEGRERVAV